MKIPATFCQHCETARFDSNLNGRCRFCNTTLYKKEVELPDLDNSTKEEAERFMDDQRMSSCDGQTGD